MTATPAARRASYVLHVATVLRYRAQLRHGALTDESESPLALILLLDNVLDLMEIEPRLRHVTLDGDSSLIETYLKARPEHFERIEQLTKAGRLLIGPWYISPEPTLTNVESLVRNLLIGLRTARVFGQPLMVGYLPEAIGLHSALPAILKGFGIHSALLSVRLPDLPAELTCTGLDGTRLLVGNLREGSFTADDTLTSIRHKLAPHADCGHLLVLTQWQANTTADQLQAWFRRLNDTAADLHDDVFDSHPGSYARALETNAIGNQYPALDIQPELTEQGRAVREWAVYLTRGLLRWVEPFFAWAENARLGRTEAHLRRPQTLIQHMWKDILRDQCAPHYQDNDNAAGREERLRYYRHRIDDLREVPLHALVENIDTDLLPVPIVTALVVFNSGSSPYRGMFRYQIGWAGRESRDGTRHTLVVYDAAGQRAGKALPADNATFVQELFFRVDVPAFGYSTFGVALEPDPPEVTSNPSLKPTRDLIGMVTTVHSGSLPLTASLIAVSDWRFEVTAIKLPEDADRGGLIVRGSNRSEDTLHVTITPFRAFRHCDVVTLDEVPTGGIMGIDPASGAFRFKATPHRLLTFWLHD